MKTNKKTINILPRGHRDPQREKEFQGELIKLLIKYGDIPMLLMNNLEIEANTRVGLTIEGKHPYSPDVDTHFVIVGNYFHKELNI